MRKKYTKKLSFQRWLSLCMILLFLSGSVSVYANDGSEKNGDKDAQTEKVVPTENKEAAPNPDKKKDSQGEGDNSTAQDGKAKDTAPSNTASAEMQTELKGNPVLDDNTNAELQKIRKSNFMPVDILIGSQFVKTDIDPFVFQSVTYVPLRSIVQIIKGASIEWSQEHLRADVTLPLTKGEKKLSFYLNSKDYLVNGKKAAMPYTTIQVNGKFMIALPVLANLMEVTESYDLKYYFIHLTLPETLINPNALDNRFYTANEVHHLSRLIYREAGAAGYSAMHGVASVVLNHYRHPYYPNTISGVIFAKAPSGAPHYVPAHKSNFQSVVPNFSSVLAAKKVLRGENSIGNSIYFNTRPFRNKKIHSVINGIYFCY